MADVIACPPSSAIYWGSGFSGPPSSVICRLGQKQGRTTVTLPRGHLPGGPLLEEHNPETMRERGTRRVPAFLVWTKVAVALKQQ